MTAVLSGLAAPAGLSVWSVLSALAAAGTAALLTGPWHRRLAGVPFQRMNLRATRRIFAGRRARIAVGVPAAAAGLAAGSVLVAAATCLACLALTGALRSRQVQRRAAERQIVSEGLLDALAAEVGSGAAPADAISALLADLPPAVAIELSAVARALQQGGDAATAWRDALTVTQADQLAAAFQVCEETGASLITVLSRLTAMAADERRRRDEIVLALAGPRSSAVLLAALPVLGVLAGAGLGASQLTFLLGSPAGHACFFLGVVLDVLGARWVARLASSAGRPQSVQ